MALPLVGKDLNSLVISTNDIEEELGTSGSLVVYTSLKMLIPIQTIIILIYQQQ